jgi:hypothetical protein
VSEEADLEVVAQKYEDWKTAGRPGDKTREEFMIELFGHVPE